MNAVAYRELERILGRALKAFAATRQKLDPYERGVRDRVQALQTRVARLRARREREADSLVREN